ncbi:acyl-CoA dehydrogenase domain protein, partial [mine drainage metagenome]
KKGVSLVIIGVEDCGVEPYEAENMASVFAGDFGGVRFDQVNIPKSRLVGVENKGFQILMSILGIQRVHVALYAIGLAEGAIEEAIEYARNRKAFSKPISKYQAISFRMAEDWSKLQSVKALAFKALAMHDSGIDCTMESSTVKGYGCEVAFDAVNHSLQAMGAAGYVKSLSMERKFRSSRGFLIGDGTPEVQKLIIARSLFGKEFAP